MISLHNINEHQPDQSCFTEHPEPETTTSQPTLTSRLSLVPRNDLKKIHKENRRIRKWLKILPKYHILISKDPKKIKKYIRKGIPNSLRGKIWSSLTNPQCLPATKNLTDLINQDSEYDGIISKDIYRTNPKHSFFSEDKGSGQESLRNVLKGLAVTYPDMGYCQGLNFIAGLLVMYCNDQEVYNIMSNMVQDYGLKEYYINPVNLRKPLFVLEELIKIFFPKVSKHLVETGTDLYYFAAKWFLTLFTIILPSAIVVRIFDIFFLEKHYILYRVCLAIIKIKKKAILKAQNLHEIVDVLGRFEEKEFEDEKLFFDVVFGIKLGRINLQKIESQCNGNEK